MRQLALLIRYEPQASPPEGDPPTMWIKSGPGTITYLDGDPSAVPREVSYETRVTMTGETTFIEDGDVTVDGGGLHLSTVGAGVLEPSAEDGTLRGAVVWRVEGSGDLAGATGLLSSNFETQPQQGTAIEHQVLRLFLP